MSLSLDSSLDSLLPLSKLKKLNTLVLQNKSQNLSNPGYVHIYMIFKSGFHFLRKTKVYVSILFQGVRSLNFSLLFCFFFIILVLLSLFSHNYSLNLIFLSILFIVLDCYDNHYEFYERLKVMVPSLIAIDGNFLWILYKLSHLFLAEWLFAQNIHYQTKLLFWANQFADRKIYGQVSWIWKKK